MSSNVWTKELVQAHAQAAVAIELYTLPFYITPLASIKVKTDPSYDLIKGVMFEEMLHLEMAANLCIALDTTPNFAVPNYGVGIPYLSPYDPVTGHHGFTETALGNLNDVIDTMLDIETPTEFQQGTHNGPSIPYNSIGEMYDALLTGIKAVGKDSFTW